MDFTYFVLLLALMLGSFVYGISQWKNGIPYIGIAGVLIACILAATLTMHSIFLESDIDMTIQESSAGTMPIPSFTASGNISTTQNAQTYQESTYQFGVSDNWQHRQFSSCNPCPDYSYSIYEGVNQDITIELTAVTGSSYDAFWIDHTKESTERWESFRVHATIDPGTLFVPLNDTDYNLSPSNADRYSLQYDFDISAYSTGWSPYEREDIVTNTLNNLTNTNTTITFDRTVQLDRSEPATIRFALLKPTATNVYFAGWSNWTLTIHNFEVTTSTVSSTTITNPDDTLNYAGGIGSTTMSTNTTLTFIESTDQTRTLLTSLFALLCGVFTMTVLGMLFQYLQVNVGGKRL